jgi:hypothetical protein
MIESLHFKILLLIYHLMPQLPLFRRYFALSDKIAFVIHSVFYFISSPTAQAEGSGRGNGDGRRHEYHSRYARAGIFVHGILYRRDHLDLISRGEGFVARDQSEKVVFNGVGPYGTNTAFLRKVSCHYSRRSFATRTWRSLTRPVTTF